MGYRRTYTHIVALVFQITYTVPKLYALPYDINGRDSSGYGH